MQDILNAAVAAIRPAPIGIAAATVDGNVHGAGEWTHPFPAQSITKVFSLALVLAYESASLWEHVGSKPSSFRYDALSELDIEEGKPRNPFLNAGALVVMDRLLKHTSGQACQATLGLLRHESGVPEIDVDQQAAADELAHSLRNLAIANLIAAYGRLAFDVETVLQHYVRQCAISATCRDLALASLFLARDGLLADGTRLLSTRDTRAVNATMLTCGTYDGSDLVTHRIGLPAKSGIGGGLLAIAPGRGAVCAWSPGLDGSGNPVSAIAAVEHFATLAGWSIF